MMILWWCISINLNFAESGIIADMSLASDEYTEQSQHN